MDLLMRSPEDTGQVGRDHGALDELLQDGPLGFTQAPQSRFQAVGENVAGLGEDEVTPGGLFKGPLDRLDRERLHRGVVGGSRFLRVTMYGDPGLRRPGLYLSTPPRWTRRRLRVGCLDIESPPNTNTKGTQICPHTPASTNNSIPKRSL